MHMKHLTISFTSKSLYQFSWHPGAYFVFYKSVSFPEIVCPCRDLIHADFPGYIDFTPSTQAFSWARQTPNDVIIGIGGEDESA